MGGAWELWLSKKRRDYEAALGAVHSDFAVLVCFKWLISKIEGWIE